jgi:hypothetical protein
MSKKLLERIIRSVLAEGRITVSIKPLQAADNQTVNNLQQRLNVPQQKRTPDNFDGFRIELQRIGGRLTNIDSDKKEYEITPDELISQAILYLNSMSKGIYSKKTTADYVWVLTGDVNLKQQNKTKAQQIFAKYVVVATYIHKDLLSKTITAATKGNLDQLRNGALVFNADSINIAQWTKQGKLTSTEAELINAPDFPVSFGQQDNTVEDLYKYFNLTQVFGFKPTFKYGCELKAAVQEFQRENKLPETGDYDQKTRDYARSLKKPSYEFSNTQAVIELAKTCNAEQASKTDTAEKQDDFKVPATGFQFNITKKDPEFFKVQKLMESVLIARKFNVHEKHKKSSIEFINGIKRSPGYYGLKTKVIVGKLKSFIIQSQVPLTNTSNEVVDQQFVDILKTMK